MSTITIEKRQVDRECRLSTVHEIRKEWQTTRSKMFLTCQKINELEQELAQARADKRAIQHHLISLETREKELLGEVKQCGFAHDTLKIKIRKAVSSSIKESLSSLSKSEKEELVKSLLEGIV